VNDSPAKTSRVWLITGAGRGLGRAFTTAAVAQGDRVIATARSQAALADLRESYEDAVLPVELEVTDRTAVTMAVSAGRAHFGRIDVLVNNAGYGLAGGVEEISEEQIRRQLDVNFFGALWCTQAVLPIMRDQGSGHIFQISSIGGLTALPNTGGYCASKFALEGLSESLASEVRPFGIRVTIIEPGPFKSDWNGTSMERATPLDAYDEILSARREVLSGAYAFTQPGEPAGAARTLLDLLTCNNPPLRMPLGALATDNALKASQDRLAEFEAWEATSRAADQA
jgi:NAD(P)-dependent dehydrogenase (short-subunit alcohol dehydrogenase family)